MTGPTNISAHKGGQQARRQGDTQPDAASKPAPPTRATASGRRSTEHSSEQAISVIPSHMSLLQGSAENTSVPTASGASEPNAVVGGGGGITSEVSTSSFETAPNSRKRAKPQSGSKEVSTAPVKRRAAGILNTAMGWARSQAKELAEFEHMNKAKGPKPAPPPLPVPTRKFAAARHDFLKSQQQLKQQLESQTGGRSQAGMHVAAGMLPPELLLAGQAGILTLPGMDAKAENARGRAQGASAASVHPVTLAFAMGTDGQLAEAINKELLRQE